MRGTASFDVLSVKIHAGVSAVGYWQKFAEPKKVVNMPDRTVANMGVYISPMCGEEIA